LLLEGLGIGPLLLGRFEAGTSGCPGNPFAAGEVADVDGVELEPPALLESEDFELDAPELLAEEPELAGLLVPMLPQAARAKTHAKGMIQFFMKNSLKEIKETA
jgi:hypothetical protein